MKIARTIVIALAVIILILLGVLIFVPSVKGPTTSGSAPIVSADRHLTVTAPAAGAVISSPVTLAGSVTGGGWFFEASFPIKILDADGTIIGQGHATAEGGSGAWMTTGTVPFAATISFRTPRYATGAVVFEKDNPSGLPQNAGELRVSVRFGSAP